MTTTLAFSRSGTMENPETLLLNVRNRIANAGIHIDEAVSRLRPDVNGDALLLLCLQACTKNDQTANRCFPE